MFKVLSIFVLLILGILEQDMFANAQVPNPTDRTLFYSGDERGIIPGQYIIGLKENLSNTAVKSFSANLEKNNVMLLHKFHSINALSLSLPNIAMSAIITHSTPTTAVSHKGLTYADIARIFAPVHVEHNSRSAINKTATIPSFNKPATNATLVCNIIKENSIIKYCTPNMVVHAFQN